MFLVFFAGQGMFPWNNCVFWSVLACSDAWVQEHGNIRRVPDLCPLTWEEHRNTRNTVFQAWSVTPNIHRVFLTPSAFVFFWVTPG